MIDAHFSVNRGPSGWVVRHNGGVLGYARSRTEAVAIAQDLLTWLREQGRAGDLKVDEPAAVVRAAPVPEKASG